MVLFLTSSCHDGNKPGITHANGFVKLLREHMPKDPHVVFIASAPDDPDGTEFQAYDLQERFCGEGFDFHQFELLDARSEQQAEELIRWANVLILGGGHVPTQNQFFGRIGLKELLGSYDGLLISISAGSMNCADTVYSSPELPGESIDPNYRRWLPGLALTNVNILPHYQNFRRQRLDGKFLLKEIILPDTEDNCFFAIPDGSFLLSVNGEERFYGHVTALENGRIYRVQ